jgi:hypothetical protein
MQQDLMLEGLIRAYIADAFDEFKRSELDGGIRFSVVASGYPSDKLNVEFVVGGRYGNDEVRSQSLVKSLHTYIARKKEDKEMAQAILAAPAPVLTGPQVKTLLDRAADQ